MTTNRPSDATESGVGCLLMFGLLCLAIGLVMLLGWWALVCLGLVCLFFAFLIA